MLKTINGFNQETIDAYIYCLNNGDSKDKTYSAYFLGNYYSGSDNKSSLNYSEAFKYYNEVLKTNDGDSFVRSSISELKDLIVNCYENDVQNQHIEIIKKICRNSVNKNNLFYNMLFVSLADDNENEKNLVVEKLNHVIELYPYYPKARILKFFHNQNNGIAQDMKYSDIITIYESFNNVFDDYDLINYIGILSLSNDLHNTLKFSYDVFNSYDDKNSDLYYSSLLHLAESHLMLSTMEEKTTINENSLQKWLRAAISRLKKSDSVTSKTYNRLMICKVLVDYHLGDKDKLNDEFVALLDSMKIDSSIGRYLQALLLWNDDKYTEALAICEDLLQSESNSISKYEVHLLKGRVHRDYAEYAQKEKNDELKNAQSELAIN